MIVDMDAVRALYGDPTGCFATLMVESESFSFTVPVFLDRYQFEDGVLILTFDRTNFPLLGADQEGRVVRQDLYDRDGAHIQTRSVNFAVRAADTVLFTCRFTPEEIRMSAAWGKIPNLDAIRAFLTR